MCYCCFVVADYETKQIQIKVFKIYSTGTDDPLCLFYKYGTCMMTCRYMFTNVGVKLFV